MFVKKIYHEGHNKNKNYSFKQALKDASRKGEMGNMNNKTNKRNNKSKQYYKKTNRQTRRRH